MIDVVDFALELVSDPVAGAISFDDAEQRNSRVSELQIKYNRLMAQLSSVISERGT